MQDRFNYRIALHQDKYEEYGLEKFKNQRIFEVKTLNIGYENSTVEIIAEYPNGDWAVREIDIEDVDLIQCTGLKDKNGTLIYEKDIVQILDDEIPYVVEYEQDRAMFIIHSKIDRVCCNFDNYSGYELEVIGNIYEHKHLLESEG